MAAIAMHHSMRIERGQIEDENNICKTGLKWFNMKTLLHLANVYRLLGFSYLFNDCV
jgi:hypothetical protein